MRYLEVCFKELHADISNLISKSLIDNTGSQTSGGSLSQFDRGRRRAGLRHPQKSGYQLNHGEMGKENIYETSRGSGQYFIVDLIYGDGIGGNGSEAIATSVEYGHLESSSTLDGHSRHSWHVSADNVLIRARQKPEDRINKEIPVCGCGSWAEVAELASAEKVALPLYRRLRPLSIR